MMNPQYPPPGPNNNAPNNPVYPPTSQDYNGVQNSNLYGQMPPNGPQMPPQPFDQPDMSQKMQNMNINGPQGFQSIPPTQLPPGQISHGQFPPNSNFGQGNPGIPGRPQVGASQFPPMGQKPPTSASEQVPTSLPPGYGPMPPQSQTPDQNRQFQPPNSMQQRPQPSQPPMGQQTGPPGQMPPHSQPNFPLQPGMGRPGNPPQSAQPQPPKPGMQQPHMGGPPMQPGQGMPQQMGMPMQQHQPGMPPQPKPPGPPGPPAQGQPIQMQRQTIPPQSGMVGAPGMPSQPGQPPQSGQQQSQPGQLGKMPGPPGPQQMSQGPPQQQGLPPQPGQLSQPGMPPQLNQMGQSSMPPQNNQAQPQSGQMPPQPGQMPPQPGQIPPQPGQMPPQPGQLPPQPGQMPPQPGQMSQFGMPPPQPGQVAQPGMPPLGQMGPPSMSSQPGQINQPGISPKHGQFGQPGLPPQPTQMNQPGMPPQPGQMSQPGLPPQPGQMLGQTAPQPGFPGQFQGQAQQMPGLPHMPPPLSQQRQYPGQPASQPGYGPPAAQSGQYPGMPSMPPQPQMPQPPMPGQQQRGYQQPSSGYPPQYQPTYPGQQPYPGQQYQQQPEQKRLDPDQMPSPIQVMADDQQNRSGVFVTNEKGQVPPLATTDFIVDDKGNASPRFIRSSMYTVPVTADLLKQTAMPFCLVISPMAETVGSEQEPPLVDFAALTGSPSLGPVRCSRCKAYMCPNMKFIDAGRHFKCAFCKATTEVPMEYTQYVNSMQQYGRVPAEMALGAYEIVATKEYCRNNTLPNPPAIVFVIDVSYNSIKNGLLQTVCDNIMDIIEAMPRDEQTGRSWTRVGFITYSSTVHFYNIKGTLAQPQMMSVGDVGDMFVPLLEGFLVLPEDSGPVLQALLQQLPLMFQDNKETETILLPAVQAGLEALKAADTSGQLFVFHTSLPTYNAPGKLINREDRKLLGTDKEKQILCPATTAYNELGQACCGAGVSVELFVCNNSYVDAATLGQLPRLSGGQLHKYTYFQAELDGPRLAWQAARAAGRSTAHDAVMRVRTSTGVRPTDFYGHLYMANTTDVELAAVDADKAIAIELKHDDKLTAEDGVYIQAALLYTHRSGQRRLRVLNLALNVAHQLADVYRAMELDTTVNFLTKQAVWALRDQTPGSVRAGLGSRCARSLAAYRRHCASPSSAGQLVLPEPMKLLPLYTNCILRSDCIAGGPDITCDDRSCAMYRALTADVETSIVYTYPRLLPLHRLLDQPNLTLQPLRASMDKMNDQGVYLLENGVHMLIWVGANASSDFVRDVFGVSSAQQVEAAVSDLPPLDTPTSLAVRRLLDRARASRRTAMRLTVMRQHDKLETVLRHFLVEDRGVDGGASYVDYLCHVHKEIRALL